MFSSKSRNAAGEVAKLSLSSAAISGLKQQGLLVIGIPWCCFLQVKD
jgi:hypothetical protein